MFQNRTMDIFRNNSGNSSQNLSFLFFFIFRESSRNVQEMPLRISSEIFPCFCLGSFPWIPSEVSPEITSETLLGVHQNILPKKSELFPCIPSQFSPWIQKFPDIFSTRLVHLHIQIFSKIVSDFFFQLVIPSEILQVFLHELLQRIALFLQ